MRLIRILAVLLSFALIMVMTSGAFAAAVVKPPVNRPQLNLRADIAIDAITLSKPIAEGDKIGAQSIFNIVIKNTGNAASAECKVKLVVTALREGSVPAELTGLLSCRELAPGASQGIAWPNLSNAAWEAGQYRLTVEVDSDKAVAEANEQNNVKTFEFTVARKSSGMTGQVTAQKQAGDVTGQLFPVRITSPTGGEWEKGSKLPITFTTTSAVGSLVKILIKKGNDTFYTLNHITVNPAGTTTHNWLIPADAITGNDYRAEVMSQANASLKGVSSVFAIRNVQLNNQPGITKAQDLSASVKANAIRVNSPTANQHWVLPGEGIVAITWEAAFAATPEKVNIKLLGEDGTLVKPLAADISFKAGSFKWPLAGVSLEPGKYRIRLTDTANNEIQGTSEIFFLDAPTIKVISPADGWAWVGRTKHEIEWNYTGPADRKVKILLNDEVVLADNISINAGNKGPGKGAFLWRVEPHMHYGDHQIKVVTTDGKMQSNPVNFKIRVPNLVITQPTGGQTWYYGDSHKIAWTFDGDPEAEIKIELRYTQTGAEYKIYHLPNKLKAKAFSYMLEDEIWLHSLLESLKTESLQFTVHVELSDWWDVSDNSAAITYRLK